MGSDVLVRHFLAQFFENDLSPDSDRHQVLAVAAAALVTIPLFVTVFMSLKYLMRPFQASGWTETTAMGDEVAFCAASLLVMAAITLLSWDALALTPRDAAILGVLPVPQRTVVRAKLTALLLFASAFAIALNAVPSLLHPLFMTAQLPMNPALLIPLTAAHALSTIMAALFGFSAVLAVRESAVALLGPARFHRVSARIRSTLLFAVLVLLALVPVRLSDSASWMFEPSPRTVLLRPVQWFAAGHGALAGRLLDGLPRPDLPPALEAEETRLTSRYRAALPRFTAAAIEGAAIVTITLTLSLVLYLRNARQLHLLEEGPPRRPGARLRAPFSPMGIRRNVARRAGLLFASRTLFRGSLHRVFVIVAVATGLALSIAIGRGPVQTLTLALQTLFAGAVVAGFRTAIRTAADYRAAWLFDVASTCRAGDFRGGIRIAGILLMTGAIGVLLPVQANEWGWRIAVRHAVNGLAIGWLMVEAAMVDVHRPFVESLPPSDGVNTVGVALGGATVIAIFIAAQIELVTLATSAAAVLYPLTFCLAAFIVRRVSAPS
ncbi:MAG TPA: hypothetical protein VL484_07375 [Vicinamibacterales bacterium]|nr:hypothetical protein [Vicinamibacterales bacterium]